MDDSRLDEDLKALAKRPRPDVPAGFDARVWSKVRRREEAPRAGWGSWLQTLRWAWATPQWAAGALALALMAGWGLGRLTSRSPGQPAETRVAGTVTGEAIDVACYFDDGASGPAHAACARRCIESGLPVGLKTKDGKVYVLIGEQMPPGPQPGPKHESFNAQLARYAAMTVTVSGTLVSKEGVTVIENARLLTKDTATGEGIDSVRLRGGTLAAAEAED
ncbi:MAG: hypothetical protein JO015_08635 [Verrucomicrobia bacterium]|nr:hypothetical protein [Verrucomicrobiota bacterium]